LAVSSASCLSWEPAAFSYAELYALLIVIVIAIAARWVLVLVLGSAS
jgi:hypothetical protein